MVRQTKESPILNLNLKFFVLPSLVFLLLYPPFLRGLYFAPELLITHVFTSVIFALCWYDKILHKDIRFFKGALDRTMLAFIFVYAISLYGAVNMRGAVGELLKVINYFMVYWITAQTVKQKKDIRILYRAIFLSAVGVAVVGIGAAVGLINYPAAVVGNRIFSTLQYPNATATFMAVGSLLGLGLLNASDTRLGKIIYMTGTMLLLTIIVASQSRGSWLIFPLILVLYFAGLPQHFRFSSFYNLVITLGVGLQIARVLQPAMVNATGSSALKYVLLGTAFVIAAQWGYDLVISWLDKRDIRAGTRKLLAVGVVAYALVVAAVYITYTAQAVPSVASHFVPSDSLKRAESINKQSSSFAARIDMSKAAFKMALDYPFNGLGGEGWNALYHRYLPYLFYSTETHNYPAKVLVETGFTGLLALMSIWFFWARNLYHFWKRESDDHIWALTWSGGAAVLVLVIHSIFDFDLSMGAMGIILWSLWGITTGACNIYAEAEDRVPLNSKRLLVSVFAGTLGALLLFVPGVSLYTAGAYGAEGAKEMTAMNWVAAEKKLNTAVRLDPFSASYAADLSQVYAIKGLASNDAVQMSLSEKFAKQAVANEPYNYQVRLRLLTFSLLSGKVDQAVEDAESLVAHNPLDVHNFEILGKIYITSGLYLFENGKKDKGKEYWEKASNLKELLNKKIEEINTSVTWQGDILQITPVIKLYEAEAAFLLGDYNTAGKLLKQLSNEGNLPEALKVEALLYLNAVKAKLGDALEARSEIDSLSERYPGLTSQFSRLIQIEQ